MGDVDHGTTERLTMQTDTTLAADLATNGLRSLIGEATRNSVSPEWLRKQGRLGKLKIFRAGRKMLVRPGDVDRLLEGSASAK
jgi:hypothetical protein